MRKRFIVVASFLGGGIALLTQLPLVWIAPHFIPENMGADIRYSGTIWDGRAAGLNDIGAVSFKLSPKALISSQLPLTFQTRSPAMQMSGKASPGRLKDFRFSGTLGQLPLRDGRLIELRGQVEFTIADMKIGEGCVSVTGQAATDFLTRNEARWRWRGPKLAGPISCEGGDLKVEMSGSENGQTIQADFRLLKDGNYRADVSVKTNQPEAGVVLPLYGFDKQPNGDFKLTEQGQWR